MIQIRAAQYGGKKKYDDHVMHCDKLTLMSDWMHSKIQTMEMKGFCCCCCYSQVYGTIDQNRSRAK